MGHPQSEESPGGSETFPGNWSIFSKNGGEATMVNLNGVIANLAFHVSLAAGSDVSEVTIEVRDGDTVVGTMEVPRGESRAVGGEGDKLVIKSEGKGSGTWDYQVIQ